VEHLIVIEEIYIIIIYINFSCPEVLSFTKEDYYRKQLLQTMAN